MVISMPCTFMKKYDMKKKREHAISSPKCVCFGHHDRLPKKTSHLS